jgi:thiol:disulfide interchange protein DsbD
MKALILILFATITIQFAKSNEVDENNLVKVTLGSTDLVTDSKNYLSFQFNIEDKWHIYWKNPGDSGIPTEIELIAPKGFKVGKILWPAPEKIPFDDLANFGYSRQVQLLVPIDIDPHITVGEYQFSANISWLVCKEKCIGQDTSFSFKVDVAKSRSADQIDLSDYSHKTINSKAFGNENEDAIRLIVPANIAEGYQFFPFDGGIFVNGEQQNFIKNSAESSLIIKLDQYRIETPKAIKGLLVDTKNDGATFQVFAPISYNDLNPEED